MGKNSIVENFYSYCVVMDIDSASSSGTDEEKLQTLGFGFEVNQIHIDIYATASASKTRVTDSLTSNELVLLQIQDIGGSNYQLFNTAVPVYQINELSKAGNMQPFTIQSNATLKFNATHEKVSWTAVQLYVTLSGRIVE